MKWILAILTVMVIGFNCTVTGKEKKRMTKSIVKKSCMAVLILVIAISIGMNTSTVNAQPSLSNKSIYRVADYTSGDCYLCSNVYMIKRKAIMLGSTKWSQITNNSARSAICTGVNDVRNSFRYKHDGVTYNARRSSLTGTVTEKKQKLISLLQSHPEGIVVWGPYAGDYDGGFGPHAVLIISYSNGVFYCADSAGNYGAYNKGIVKFNDSIMRGIGYCTQYHYLSSVTGTPLSKSTYTIMYSDGMSGTSREEDAATIPNQAVENGVSTRTTMKKFTRPGYHYDAWHIYRFVDGKANYWCREKGTGGNPKWIPYDQIPSTYYKTKIAHGGNILFTLNTVKSIYLTPVWEKDTYNLRYSDGLSATSYDEDSKAIPTQTVESGVLTKTTTKKFTRPGYHYDYWHIAKLVNGKASYWCRENGTGGNPKWIPHDQIPPTYYKVKVAHGGSITFSPGHGATLFLTPQWVKDDAAGAGPPSGPPAADKEIQRIYGAGRVETSIKSADALKARKGISKFSTAIIATGTNYPDALTGCYLAKVKDAPILLVNEYKESTVSQYLKSSVNGGGKVYLLGGTGAIRENFEKNLKAMGYDVERLSGATRYGTNLEILKEAGVRSEDLLVCTGNGFADSLSAAAAGKPILLVDRGLSTEQKAYLDGLDKNKKAYLIGGTGAVSDSFRSQLRPYASGGVSRVYGDNRYETSRAVAEAFFAKADSVVLAWAQDFPDGLSGGPLAMSMGAPLVLADNSSYQHAAQYAGKAGVKKAAVLGGTPLISDQVVNKIVQ